MTSKNRPSQLWETLRRLLRAEGVNADELSVDKLQEALGISRGTTQRIKEGHENITQKTVAQLAERFNVPRSYISDGAAGHLPDVDPRLVLAGSTAKDAASSYDRARLSSMAVHLAITLDSIKNQEKRVKAFANAVVAINNIIGHSDDVDGIGQ